MAVVDCEMVCGVADGRGARMYGGVPLQTECAAGTSGSQGDSLGGVRARVREQSVGRCLIVPQVNCKLLQSLMYIRNSSVTRP